MSANCHECEPGLPEWVMSYADMITILMAFFVVMYSMAGDKDNSKEEAVMKALRDQFGPEVRSPGADPSIFERFRSSQIELPHQGGTKRKDANRGGADQHLVPQGEFGRPHARIPGEPARVGGTIYFTDDATALSATQEQILKSIAGEVEGKPQKIEIRGHSPRRAARNEDVPDDWDLAFARCRATMDYLTVLGIDPRRFRLGVAGDNEPIATRGPAASQVPQSRVEVYMLNEVVEGSGAPDAKRATASKTKPNEAT